MAGFLNEARRPGTRTDFSVVGCDEYIERKLLSFSRQRGRVGGYLSTCPCQKREQDELAIIVHGHSLEIEVCKEEYAKGILTALAQLSF